MIRVEKFLQFRQHMSDSRLHFHGVSGDLHVNVQVLGQVGVLGIATDACFFLLSKKNTNGENETVKEKKDEP